MANPRVQDVSENGLQLAEGFDTDLARLKAFLSGWIGECDREVQPLLRWQLLGRSKYFRPVTVFSCHDAMFDSGIDDRTIQAAAAVELVHNVSLIIDDILDRSQMRRGVRTLHCRYGLLPALMAAGFITAAAYELLDDDEFGIRQLSMLFKRLAVAESVQWRLRRKPLGVEDWRMLAGEDTGSMFEACACLGTRDESLRRFGRLLGMVYHGCDDVGDVRGVVGLGGGGAQDIRDGILTLPVAFAIRDPEVALEFRRPTQGSEALLLQSVQRALPEAEGYLNKLAAEAEEEATRRAPKPAGLVALVRQTRRLSA